MWVSPVERHFKSQECTYLIKELFLHLVLVVKYLGSIVTMFVDFMMQS